MKSAGRRTWRRFTTVVASLCVVLSGCGGGSDDVAPEPSSVALAPGAAASDVQVSPKRKVLPHDRKGITAIVVAQDGSSVAVASSDGRTRILDGSGSREIRVLSPEGSSPAAGLIFSADGRLLVTVSRDSVGQVWDVATGQRKFSLRGHEQAIRAVAASPDGSIIASGGEETRVLLWDGTNGRLKRVLRGHTDFVNSLSVSPDGLLLASGDVAGRILVWNVESGRLLFTLRGHANEVNAVAFGADSRRLASAGEDGKVLLWDMNTGQQAQSLGSKGVPVRSLAFSGDGLRLAAGGVDGRVVVWDMASLSIAQDLTASPTAVNSMAFAVADKNQLFVGTAESRITSWNLPRGAAR